MRAVDLHSRRLAAAHRITGPQLVCLAHIDRLGPLPSAELARHVHLSPSTIVGILDRLEARGWIQRVRSAEDRRRILLSATEAGRELLAQAPSPLQDRLLENLAALPEADRRRLAGALDEIVALMEATDLEVAPLLHPGPLDESPPPPAALPRRPPRNRRGERT
ncbi:MAG: MarR family transcriptional regulator [Gemmatimonadetes bacterium]|nr:MarR family transcriptional regulator [Gemmatimonadota bacterium]